jgi:hypothetical protein
MNRRIRAQASVRGSGRGGGVQKGASGYQVLAGWLSRVARLDFSVFDEVKSERTATASAVLVVLGASLLAGLGSWIWSMQHDDYNGLGAGEVFIKTVLGGSVVQTMVFFAWVYLTHLLLTRMFGAQVLFQELVRTMGLAFAPVSLSLFVAVAPLAVPFGVLSLGLALLASNAAVEQTAGVTPREATFANVAGFAAFLVFMGAFANVAEAGVFGGLAPGLLFFSLDF